jgi:hypothetical protein
VLEIVTAEDDFGFAVDLGESGVAVKAPLAAGVVEQIYLSSANKLKLGERHSHKFDKNCTIALDGEREIQIEKGDVAEICVDRTGPWRVDVYKTLEKAHNENFFRASTDRFA